jgi:DNA-binding transcriptional regulator YiaG
MRAILRCLPRLSEYPLCRISHLHSKMKSPVSPAKRSDAKPPFLRTYRSEIAALKRRLIELERQLRQLGRAGQLAKPTAANEDSVSPGTRFSAKSMAAQRRRLGLSAADCGLLVGASSQSVYNWEEGKARPRAQHLPAIFALRNLGRRQANEILESRKAA